METGTSQQKIPLAFINDKSPILELICNDLIASGFQVLFRSENIDDGLSKLSCINALPKVCIIDLDFFEKDILMQLQKLRNQYPTIKLVAHTEIDDAKLGKTLSDIGFSGYLLIGRDVQDFKKAIEKILK